MYQKVQQLFMILALTTAVTFLAALAMLFSSPILAVVVFVVSLILIGLIVYARTYFYGAEGMNAYEVSFVRREGINVDMRQTNYMLKNLSYLLAIQYPNRRFSVLVCAENQFKPILLSPLKKEVIEEVVSNNRDLSQMILRFKDAPIEIYNLYRGRAVHLVEINDSNVTSDSQPVNLTEIAKAGFAGVYLNLSYMPRFSQELTGNLAVVSERGQFKKPLEIINAVNQVVADTDKVIANQPHPYVRLYNGIFKTLVNLVISDEMIERVEITRFPPVPNVVAPLVSPKDQSEAMPKKAWVVAASGEKNDSPVYLRQKILVIQDFIGLSNPATIWAAHMTTDPGSPFAILDFSTATTSIRGLNANLFTTKNVAVLAAPSETPEYFVNLLSVWNGIADEYRPQLIGVLLRYLERFSRFIFSDLNRKEQDRMATIIQGTFFLLAIQHQAHDLCSFASLLSDLPTVMVFLKKVSDAMNLLIYENQRHPDLMQVYETLQNLGCGVRYEHTLARNEPSPEDLQLFAALKKRIAPFLDETGNIILANGTSRTNPMSFHSIILDASRWEGNLNTCFLENVFTSLQYFQMVRDYLGVPTNVLIHGISSLKPEAQARAMLMLDDYLTTFNGRGRVIVADTEILDGYASLVKKRAFEDVYLFQTKNIGQMTELLGKIKLVESIYTLPKQCGYLLRFMPDGKKIVPGNIYTAKPQEVTLKASE